MDYLKKSNIVQTRFCQMHEDLVKIEYIYEDTNRALAGLNRQYNELCVGYKELENKNRQIKTEAKEERKFMVDEMKKELKVEQGLIDELKEQLK